jgi:energy-coupling factor transport system permease protein
MLFEYRQKSTTIHRLHPLAKAIWVLSTGIVLSFYFDPRSLLVILLIMVPFVFAASIPWKQWLKPIGFVTLLTFLSFTIMSLFLTRPDIFQNYPGWVSKTYIELAGPEFFMGRIAFTQAGLAYASGLTLRTFIMLWVVSTFIYSTSPSNLIFLLVQVKLPSKMTFIVMAAYRFFPHIFRKLTTVMTAQKLRGWELSSKNPIKLAREYAPITIPVLTETVRVADQTTRAIEARAFGAAPFTLHHDLVLTLKDFLFILFWVSFVAFFLWIYISYNIGKL